MSVLEIVLAALLLCQATMTLTWLIANRIDNYSIVDITWSVNFPLIALLLAANYVGSEFSSAVMALPVTIWGLRLGYHLYVRIRSHIEVEDGRYIALRQEYGARLKGRFYRFYTMQSVSNVLLAIPFFIQYANPQPHPSSIQIAGVVIWLIGTLGESIADKQLADFKSEPHNKGKVCNAGLWGWSRHPNYFFEFTIWIGFALTAYGLPYWPLAFLSPLIIWLLLLFVTGVPLNEKQNLESKGEAYRRYQEQTSKFFPLPPKRK
ncbi:MAG TPA: DUF1295 domain-containing protein [Luteibaculaceae bacterium]|nr:DUF1295 domain-containing protein [Luteibaculaceae bacterium]